MRIPHIRLPHIRSPLDVDDALLLAGTGVFTIGLWGFDYRAALMVLGVWLIWLARPNRGGR